MINILKKLKLLKKISESERIESNDYEFGGKVRNLITHFNETGEIKSNPNGRRL